MLNISKPLLRVLRFSSQGGTMDRLRFSNFKRLSESEQLKTLVEAVDREMRCGRQLKEYYNSVMVNNLLKVQLRSDDEIEFFLANLKLLPEFLGQFEGSVEQLLNQFYYVLLVTRDHRPYLEDLVVVFKTLNGKHVKIPYMIELQLSSIYESLLMGGGDVDQQLEWLSMMNQKQLPCSRLNYYLATLQKNEGLTMEQQLRLVSLSLKNQHRSKALAATYERVKASPFLLTKFLKMVENDHSHVNPLKADPSLLHDDNLKLLFRTQPDDSALHLIHSGEVDLRMLFFFKAAASLEDERDLNHLDHFPTLPPNLQLKLLRHLLLSIKQPQQIIQDDFLQQNLSQIRQQDKQRNILIEGLIKVDSAFKNQIKNHQLPLWHLIHLIDLNQLFNFCSDNTIKLITEKLNDVHDIHNPYSYNVIENEIDYSIRYNRELLIVLRNDTRVVAQKVFKENVEWISEGELMKWMKFRTNDELIYHIQEAVIRQLGVTENLKFQTKVLEYVMHQRNVSYELIEKARDIWSRDDIPSKYKQNQRLRNVFK